MRVLLIEPDKIQADVYSRALSFDGHEVMHAFSAQGAVHKADEHKPDAVVLELQLPNHNGVEFLYEFRSYPEWLDIPVLIHTFVPSVELAHASTLANELGARGLLHKPETTLVQLRSAVRSLAPVEP